MSEPDAPGWWQHGIIYQIYPRSFQDSDGDGVGDLSGIARRLDHLVELGVDAVWLSPIFPSPMADFGYDISDYTGVDPLFGTLDDFDALVRAVHGRDMRLLLDLVPSHTSDQHPWFLDARSGRTADKRDWYIWRDAAPDGGPPNNWLSEFGGPAWTWDEPTGQYYLSIYLPEQPALNWRNPQVRAAMYDVMRFWFDRGVDGFRVDAVAHLAPDDAFRDNPPNPDWQPGMDPAQAVFRIYTRHQDAGFDYVREMRAVADEYPERVLVGEAYGPLEDIIRYYGEALDGFHLPFNFELLAAPWDAGHIADYADTYEAALPDGAWPNWVLGNHDRSRVASRIGPAQARVAALLLLTLRGTPTIYQGDELGLEDTPIPPDAVQDPWERNVPGQGLGRDPVRTPMIWEDAPNCGFTTGAPWLPMPKGANASAQAADPGSMLSIHRRIIALRRAEPALSVGGYERVSAEDGVFTFARAHEGRRLVVSLNMTSKPRPLEVEGRLLLSTRAERTDISDGVLGPNEGVVIEPV